MAGYIGNTPVPQATQTRQSFIATASQTTFTTVGYLVGFVDVYMNGVHLVDGTDYDATDGSTIVLASGAALNDTIDVVIFTASDDVTQVLHVGGGLFKGERGTYGSTGAAGDIFRVHEQTLNTDVSIGATENAIAAGPLTVATGVTLIVTTGGNLAIV